MSKRALITVVTPLPRGLSRESVMETLHSHFEMIDLNPLVTDRSRCEPPDHCNHEQRKCLWYKITDEITYIPGLPKGNVSYNASFYDLPRGLQTHVFAPMGIEIKGKWTLGGTLPGEPKETEEIGVEIPKEGLYLREDVDLSCNMLMIAFVKKDLKKSHKELVQKLIEKALERDRMTGRTAKAMEALPPAYGSQQSLDQKPSNSQKKPGLLDSYYGQDSKRPTQHPLQGSGLPHGGQSSHSQSSFHSAYSQPQQPLAQHPQYSQHSLASSQSSQPPPPQGHYPYPQGPHAPPAIQQQYQPQHSQPTLRQDAPAELGGSEPPSLMPQPLHVARTGSPSRPAEMQG